MKTKQVVCVAALMCAAVSASYWLGDQHGRRSSNRALNAVSSAIHRTLAPGGGSTHRVSGVASSRQVTNSTIWESKTVEQEIPVEPARQIEDMKWQMQKFSQEGWSVVNFSGPIRQADGTFHRKWELKRAKQ